MKRSSGGRTRAMRTAAVAATALAAVSLGAVVPARRADAAPSESEGRPNVLFVLADDLDTAEMAYMPEVAALLGRHGASFDDYFVSDSLCCPSRTTTLRGQYAHNTGVLNNSGPRGGFARAFRLGIERHTIATRLRRAGYRTGLFGKYLNGYPRPAGSRYVPPGWTAWASPVAGDPYSEYDYTLNHHGRLATYGHRPEDYGTDVYFGLARRFIERSAARHQPFFAFVSVFAPHEPATPAPADVDRFAGATAPRTPAFDQADMAGMPAFLQRLPAFTPEETAAIDRLYQRRLESLQAVDRGVADLVGTLRALRQLKHTYVVFASDNGFHLGQHRLPAGKELPYDTDLHVPLLVRGPGIPEGRRVSTMANNADLAPTFSAMAGTGRSSHWDGRSLLGAARGHRRGGRAVHLVEHWAIARPGAAVPVPPADTVLEPPDVDESVPRAPGRTNRSPGGATVLTDHDLYGRFLRIPDYAGVRTRRYLYVEYVNGDRELYDLVADPDETHNLAGTQPDVEQALAQTLATMRTCRAAGCRTADQRDPLRGPRLVSG